MAEIRDCPGWLGYQIGDDGRAWSLWAPGCKSRLTDIRQPLRPYRCDKYGHLSVGLNRRVIDGKRGVIRRSIHRLVLEAFVGPCPPGMVCRHFPDRNPANNNLSNLQWGTHLENSADARSHGTIYDRRGIKSHRAKLTEEIVREVFRLDASGVKYSEIAERLMIPSPTVQGILYGKTWKHLGLSRTMTPANLAFRKRPRPSRVESIEDEDRAAVERLLPFDSLGYANPFYSWYRYELS